MLMHADPILDIRDLSTVFRIGGRDVAAVRDLDLTIAPDAHHCLTPPRRNR
jgi:peptide/nickel transport system ATP-binding protein